MHRFHFFPGNIIAGALNLFSVIVPTADLFVFRACGILVCSSCSTQLVRLPESDSSSIPLTAVCPRFGRACDQCWERLREKDGSSLGSSQCHNRELTASTLFESLSKEIQPEDTDVLKENESSRKMFGSWDWAWLGFRATSSCSACNRLECKNCNQKTQL